ncbi:DUF6307 family protein [Amycolatopsis sp. GM8]|uniref:DUF6307 family protein n=1 Tax=Amycolatopsis sp. GM8 TaxID=2896530 RepID=UPI001F20FB3F|nr:DUF6307 family protein [Amycolatopsis sp. GM8]
MMSNTVVVSRYEQRLQLVQKIIRNDTELSEKQGRELAVRLLHTLDTVPETVR